MKINQYDNAGWFICDAGNFPVFGPYTREKDAKGALTRLKNKHIG